MIRKLVLLLLMLSAACLLHGQSQRFSYQRDYDKMVARTRQSKDTLYYPSLLPLFLRNDPKLTINKTFALMVGYTGLPGFMPFEDLAIEKKLYELNDSAHYETVVSICDTFLKTHPLNQLAIIEKSYAFHKLGQEDSSRFYKTQFTRIMAAMDWSADGRSPDHAMFSIGPRDGRNYVDKFYHSEVGRTGSDEDSHGNFCDMVEMIYKRGGKTGSVVFFFAIQHAVNTTAKKTKH